MFEPESGVRRSARHTRHARRPGGLVTVVVVATAVAAGALAREIPPVGADGNPTRSGPPLDRVVVGGEGSVTYVPPVAAPAADPFRPPATPYGPGNRGIEYATSSGDEVRASAAGKVLFAGHVAGALHVTLGHADGVRTSYSFLASVEVARGQRVAQGDRLGTAGGRLHVGARIGDVYLDPAVLFAASGGVQVELLPLETPTSRSTAAWEPPGAGDVGGWLGAGSAVMPGGAPGERRRAMVGAVATREAIGLLTGVLGAGSGSTTR
ncbi:MAG TPA: M23 family metallopeptidase [Acidimicrobiales bacterium]